MHSLQKLKLMCAKHLEQCLADSKLSVHVTIMFTVTSWLLSFVGSHRLEGLPPTSLLQQETTSGEVCLQPGEPCTAQHSAPTWLVLNKCWLPFLGHAMSHSILFQNGFLHHRSPLFWGFHDTAQLFLVCQYPPPIPFFRQNSSLNNLQEYFVLLQVVSCLHHSVLLTMSSKMQGSYPAKREGTPGKNSEDRLRGPYSREVLPTAFWQVMHFLRK